MLNAGKRRTIGVILIAFGIWLGWFALVLKFLNSQAAVSEPVTQNLSRAGQFGDAFGVLGSFMATAAAAAAFVALWSQQDERKSREFEENFYRTLSNFQQIVSEIDIERTNFEKITGRPRSSRYFGEPQSRQAGRDALRALLCILEDAILTEQKFNNSKTIYKA